MPIFIGRIVHPTNVGYGPSVLQENGLFAGASFANVGNPTEMIDLTDLRVTGYENDPGFCDGYVQMQQVNDWGHTIATYVWMDDGLGDHENGWFGWYPFGSTDPVADRLQKGVAKIQPGEGLWSSCTAGGFSLVSSGEVETKTDIIVTLQENGLGIINPTPVPVDLADTYVTGYMEKDGYCDGFVQVQELNDWGHTIATYVWMDDGSGNHEASWYGWYPFGSVDPVSDKLKRNVVTVQPGVGLWTSCTSDGYFFSWPKVDL